jgi:hypothetical protein
MRRQEESDVGTTTKRRSDPFLARLDWILEHAGELTSAPAQSERTRALVRNAAGLTTPRGLQKWQAGSYPKGGKRRNQSLLQLEAWCREELPGYPPPDGFGPPLDEVAAEAWGLRERGTTAEPKVDPPGRWFSRAHTALVLVVALAALLVAASLLWNDGSEQPQRSSESAGAVTLTFNDLGAGSSVVKVYAGAQDTTSDRQATGRYYNGESLPALCVERGRPVHSVASLGEESRQSDLWVKVAGEEGSEQFATLVYADLDAPVTNLPRC